MDFTNKKPIKAVSFDPNLIEERGEPPEAVCSHNNKSRYFTIAPDDNMPAEYQIHDPTMDENDILHSEYYDSREKPAGIIQSNRADLENIYKEGFRQSVITDGLDKCIYDEAYNREKAKLQAKDEYESRGEFYYEDKNGINRIRVASSGNSFYVTPTLNNYFSINDYIRFLGKVYVSLYIVYYMFDGMWGMNNNGLSNIKTEYIQLEYILKNITEIINRYFTRAHSRYSNNKDFIESFKGMIEAKLRSLHPREISNSWDKVNNKYQYINITLYDGATHDISIQKPDTRDYTFGKAIDVIEKALMNFPEYRCVFGQLIILSVTAIISSLIHNKRDILVLLGNGPEVRAIYESYLKFNNRSGDVSNSLSIPIESKENRANACIVDDYMLVDLNTLTPKWFSKVYDVIGGRCPLNASIVFGQNKFFNTIDETGIPIIAVKDIPVDKDLELAIKYVKLQLIDDIEKGHITMTESNSKTFEIVSTMLKGHFNSPLINEVIDISSKRLNNLKSLKPQTLVFKQILEQEITSGRVSIISKESRDNVSENTIVEHNDYYYISNGLLKKICKRFAFSTQDITILKKDLSDNDFLNTYDNAKQEYTVDLIFNGKKYSMLAINKAILRGGE